MEIMQQQSSNPLDSRWRGHVPLPYATAHSMALPNLHDLRQQQQQQQQQQRPHHHMHHQQQHLPQQQQQLQLQQQLQQQHRQLLKQTRSQPAEAGSSRGHHSQPSSSSSSSSSSISLLSSPQPSPHTPATGKSGGTKDEGEKKEGGEWEPYNAGAAFLGPTLWDKTLSYDSDLKLEYMDLDEFLNENGIPIEEANKALGRGAGGGGDGGGRPSATKGGNNNSGGGGDMTSPAASMSPETPSPSSPDGTPMGLGAMPQGPPQPGPHPAMPQLTNNSATPAPQPPHSVPPPCMSPDDHSLDDCCSPDSGSPHSPALQVHEGDSIRASLGREKVRGCIRLSTKGNAAKEEQQKGLTIDFEVSPNDLALATVPGQDFDPRTRMFTEDELKPQPMIKKSRKQFVPAELKDDKYWARRRKNNLAAKRSRDARRLKENQIAMRANFLEKENLALRRELESVAQEVDSLKTRLVKYEKV